MLFPHPSLVQFSAWNVQSKLRKIWNWLRLRHSHTRTHITIYLCECVCLCLMLIPALLLPLTSAAPLSLSLYLSLFRFHCQQLPFLTQRCVCVIIIISISLLYDYMIMTTPVNRTVSPMRVEASLRSESCLRRLLITTRTNWPKSIYWKSIEPQTPIQTPQTHTNKHTRTAADTHV